MKIYSRAAWAICSLLVLTTGIFYYPKWEQPQTEATISWDASGYYMYLPALFIYNDLKKCSFSQEIIEKYRPSPQFDQAFLHSSGNYVMKYSAGQALVFSPFFLAAHFITQNFTSYPADGFSFPYQIAIGIGALFYAVLGLFFIRKVLLHYFSDKTTAVTLVCIVFGSNYLNYAAIDGAMTHNTLFTLYSLLFYITIRFYRSPSISKAAITGALAGLATLIRPTEIISVIIPLLWGVYNKTGFVERIRFFINRKKIMLTGIISFILVISVQLVYWKYVSGQWLVYSYQDEGFDFLKPHLKNFLISYRSGWFIYSPIMLLIIPGFIFLYRKHRELFPAIFIFSIIFIYISSAWETWWYGGSLGQRTMIQAYPVLAFTLAALIGYILSQRLIYKVIFSLFILFCSWYNLWLTHQGHRGGLLAAGEMTRAYYYAIFGKYEIEERARTLLDNPYMFPDHLPGAALIYLNDFESDSSKSIITENAIEGKSIFLDAGNQFSPEYNVVWPSTEKNRIRATADFRAVEKEWNTWKMTQFIVRFYQNEELVKTNQIRVYRILKQGETKNITIDVKIPSKKFNRVGVSFWNAGSDKKIIIDNLKVFIF